jgi:putative Mn2+ efflux pump MntP
MSFAFLIDNLLLGTGLAMDAFSVSVANGLRDPHMRRRERYRIAGVFAFFQFLMPVLGWLGIRLIMSAFAAFHRAVPWIALILLGFIGGKMVLEGIRGGNEETEPVSLAWSTLLLQGIATSIDALSAGFALAEYTAVQTLLSGLIIAAVTLTLCLIGVRAGQKAGQYLTRWASVAGGLILIGIGIKIFIEGVL